MKKIVVFGGAFNPPLNSHFSLAEQIVNEYEGIEKIIFMPVNSKYQKKEVLVSDEHRYNMLKLVCDDNKYFEVSTLELDSNRPLYTIETLKLVKEKYPEKEIIFMTGSDNLKEFETWNNPQEILDNFSVLVLERDDDSIEEIINSSEFLNKNKTSFLKIKNQIRSNLSSSFVRKQIREGKSIRYLMPDAVYKYIKQNKLYEEM